MRQFVRRRTVRRSFRRAGPQAEPSGAPPGAAELTAELRLRVLICFDTLKYSFYLPFVPKVPLARGWLYISPHLHYVRIRFDYMKP